MHSSTVSPGKRRSRNVVGVSHPDRTALEAILRETMVDPPTPSNQKQQGATDGRTTNGRQHRKPVLQRITDEGKLRLWQLCTNNVHITHMGDAFAANTTCREWITHKTQGKGGKHDLAIPPYSDESQYGTVSMGGKLPKIRVIQLALWSRVHRLVDSQHNSSHLCHNSFCIDPVHLEIETIRGNAERNNCVCWRYVNVGDVRQKVLICQHHPPCLRPDTKGLMQSDRVHDPTNPRGWRGMTEKEKQNPLSTLPEWQQLRLRGIKSRKKVEQTSALDDEWAEKDVDFSESCRPRKFSRSDDPPPHDDDDGGPDTVYSGSRSRLFVERECILVD